VLIVPALAVNWRLSGDREAGVVGRAFFASLRSDPADAPAVPAAGTRPRWSSGDRL